MVDKKDNKKKSKKIINVKGSVSKKQEQKKKGVKQSQSLTVNVNLGKRKSSKPSAPKPVQTFQTIAPFAQPISQPQTYTDFISLGNKLNTTYTIDKPVENNIIKPFSERVYPIDPIIPINMNRVSDYFSKGSNKPFVIDDEQRIEAEQIRLDRAREFYNRSQYPPEPKPKSKKGRPKKSDEEKQKQKEEKDKQKKQLKEQKKLEKQQIPVEDTNTKQVATPEEQNAELERMNNIDFTEEITPVIRLKKPRKKPNKFPKLIIEEDDEI
jgi:hypothetical protein